jgi:dihydroorotase-like cyclic amidohydrolase
VFQENKTMSSFTQVVKGGLVVSPQGISLADVAIKDEKVALIGADIAPEGARVVDASGKYVIPGAIDVHTHPVYTGLHVCHRSFWRCYNDDPLWIC